MQRDMTGSSGSLKLQVQGPEPNVTQPRRRDQMHVDPAEARALESVGFQKGQSFGMPEFTRLWQRFEQR